MRKILVVDDDVDILALVKIMLTMQSFTVEAISRWQDISATIERFSPDLILLDVSLVGADGRQICKQIKQTESTQHIPVILFSANNEMGANIQEYKAQAFIAKPFEFAYLVETIKQNLN